MAALTGAALLSLLRAADEKDAIKKMPWSVILMVCGVTVLIGVLSAQRGMDLFTDLLARIATPGTVTFMIALVTGAVSVYSSTSGVVLPAFLPTVPGLAERLGVGSAVDRRVDVRRRAPRRSVAALDDRRALHRGAAERGRRQEAVQSAAVVGPVDDAGRRGDLLDAVLEHR